MLSPPRPLQTKEALSGVAHGLPRPAQPEEALAEARLMAGTRVARRGLGGVGAQARGPTWLGEPRRLWVQAWEPNRLTSA